MENFSPGVLLEFKFPHEIYSKRIVLGICQPCLLFIIGVHYLERLGVLLWEVNIYRK